MLPANLAPVDRHPAAKLRVPSSEVCAALRDAFSAAGLASVELVDWTPLASDPEVDPAHLALTLTLTLALTLALTLTLILAQP